MNRKSAIEWGLGGFAVVLLALIMSSFYQQTDSSKSDGVRDQQPQNAIYYDDWNPLD